MSKSSNFSIVLYLAVFLAMRTPNHLGRCKPSLAGRRVCVGSRRRGLDFARTVLLSTLANEVRKSWHQATAPQAILKVFPKVDMQGSAGLFQGREGVPAPAARGG